MLWCFKVTSFIPGSAQHTSLGVLCCHWQESEDPLLCHEGFCQSEYASHTQILSIFQCHMFLTFCIPILLNFLPKQMCDIGDASRGSLSSYAYTLMVLFFLQQRSPPVIPVLQEVMFVWRLGKKKKVSALDFFWCDFCTCQNRLRLTRDSGFPNPGFTQSSFMILDCRLFCSKGLSFNTQLIVLFGRGACNGKTI